MLFLELIYGVQETAFLRKKHSGPTVEITRNRTRKYVGLFTVKILLVCLHTTFEMIFFVNELVCKHNKLLSI